MQPDILEALYKKYYHTAYIYTLSLCQNKHIAEDIVSEAFEKAILSLDEDKLYFKYWILAVCKNLWIDNLRRERKRASFLKTKDNIYEDSIESNLEVKEKNDILHKSIMSLPLNYREVLTLHYFGNLPLIEISKLMKISNSNAKTMLFRARLKLKKVLEDFHYEF